MRLRFHRLMHGMKLTSNVFVHSFVEPFLRERYQYVCTLIFFLSRHLVLVISLLTELPCVYLIQIKLYEYDHELFTWFNICHHHK